MNTKTSTATHLGAVLGEDPNVVQVYFDGLGARTVAAMRCTETDDPPPGTADPDFDGEFHYKSARWVTEAWAWDEYNDQRLVEKRIEFNLNEELPYVTR